MHVLLFRFIYYIYNNPSILLPAFFFYTPLRASTTNVRPSKTQIKFRNDPRLIEPVRSVHISNDNQIHRHNGNERSDILCKNKNGYPAGWSDRIKIRSARCSRPKNIFPDVSSVGYNTTLGYHRGKLTRENSGLIGMPVHRVWRFVRIRYLPKLNFRPVAACSAGHPDVPVAA